MQWRRSAGNFGPNILALNPCLRIASTLISQVIDTISGQHTTVADFQSAIANEIPKLTAFVTSKDLVTLDPSKPLVVRKEPAYMAGVAGASMSSPGPYDKGRQLLL